MQLSTPYTMIVSGQTGSGKTMFVDKLLRSDLHANPFDKIILAYAIMQPIYLTMQAQIPGLSLTEGFPDDITDPAKLSEGQTLLILDDLMLDLENDKRLAVMFTKMRHCNVSTIFIVQNLYHSSKYMTTVTRNAHYLALMPNPRDAGMINTLGRQIYPLRPKFLPDAFAKATAKPYGYLFLDLKPHTDARFRVREGILPGEQEYVYLPK